MSEDGTRLNAHPPLPAPDIRAMLVDDHDIWRDGLRSILEDTEFRVVAEASSGVEAARHARRLSRTGRPAQLTLLDIRMAGADGLDTLRTLKADNPAMVVVMLTAYENSSYMARAIAGGAAGYLLKGIKREPLLQALRAVTHGEMLLSQDDLVRALRGVSLPVTGAEDLLHPLSERELEVLRLVSAGLSNQEIAALLYISECTVKTHVLHITGKLGVSDRVQAAVWAARHGVALPTQ